MPNFNFRSISKKVVVTATDLDEHPLTFFGIVSINGCLFVIVADNQVEISIVIQISKCSSMTDPLVIEVPLVANFFKLQVSKIMEKQDFL